MSKRKTVLFGGTFDPVHIGHISVAADAAEQIGADAYAADPQNPENILGREKPLGSQVNKPLGGHRRILAARGVFTLQGRRPLQ